MQEICSAAFNIQPDGAIVMDGDHAPATSLGWPFDSLGIVCSREGIGLYRVTGAGVEAASGWRASVYRDENDAPTIRLSIQQEEDAVLYACTDPATGQPKDIVYMLTVRVSINVSALAAISGGETDLGGES